MFFLPTRKISLKGAEGRSFLLLDECNRYKVICRCTDIVDGPGRIMLRQKFRNTICPMSLRIFAFVPVEEFYFIVKRLLLIVYGDIDLDVLSSGFLRDGDSDVAHNQKFFIKK